MQGVYPWCRMISNANLHLPSTGRGRHSQNEDDSDPGQILLGCLAPCLPADVGHNSLFDLIQIRKVGLLIGYSLSSVVKLFALISGPSLPDDSALLGVSRGRVDGDEESDAVLGAAEHLRRLQHHRALHRPQVLGHVAGL